MKKKSNPLDKKLKHYLGALAENYTENLKSIKEGSVIVNKKLDDINRTLGQNTEMIGTLMEDVSIIKGDLKKKVDYDEFISLVKRVQKIEAKV